MTDSVNKCSGKKISNSRVMANSFLMKDVLHILFLTHRVLDLISLRTAEPSVSSSPQSTSHDIASPGRKEQGMWSDWWITKKSRANGSKKSPVSYKLLWRIFARIWVCLWLKLSIISPCTPAQETPGWTFWLFSLAARSAVGKMALSEVKARLQHHEARLWGMTVNW